MVGFNRTRAITVLAVALVASIVVLSRPTAPGGQREVPLVWHVETTDGRALHSRGEDDPINPASVVKVATTLWALERLGPEHRFDTRFAIRGKLDPASGVLDGDLLVLGTGDPDFHVENAYLVARALNRAGVSEVSGSLLVDDRFWIGWEGGSARRKDDPSRRAAIMALRLREAFDPERWKPPTKRSLAELTARRGLAGEEPPRVVVRGAPGRFVESNGHRDLVVHRSNPLVQTLKRFNSFSNNDIERLGPTLGSAEDLAAFLATRWGVAGDTLRVETLSGLGTNRMTSRLVVRLLEDLRATCDDLGLAVQDVLPAAGCDPGTLEHFSRLRNGDAALVAKTGTLTKTDGGVVVLAGFVGTTQGEMVFCVAAPRSGGGLVRARAEQQRWLLDLIARHDGARPGSCGLALGFSDDQAQVVEVD
jgi:D-alanyl-D-alanine carboxypeptidase/D-alanyl-D-alanine-endopeptidase (penicillin-binding protein 4)